VRASASRLRGYGLEGLRPDEWRDAAMCTKPQSDADWWHSDDADDKATAKRWCAVCPVIKVCLANTMREETKTTAKMRFGIRAGLTGPQRYRLQQGKPAGAP
jgi:hypothetical protein